jgi:Uma2 family endonuclease
MIDPPPDLVIEIDITSPSLNKFPISAGIGVPEIWRYDGYTLTIFRLEGGEYDEAEGSIALPGLTNAVITRFLEESRSLER